ncbi:MAG: DUF484 family protein [Gammaproteobacteria bacterium]|jgi:uncharacterized protein YigA (DUF484 family)|nr:DUF484 family protein [Gammaproteobacteria bacterium]
MSGEEGQVAGDEMERQVADYLAGHPEFFARHADLLTGLRIPHQPGEAVSLVERQLGLLRAQADQLRAQLQDLIGVARDNERLHDRLHRLTLALMDAPGPDAVLDTLRTELTAHFGADAVALRRAADADELNRPHDPADAPGARLLRELLATGRPRCGPLGPLETAYFFGPNASDARSVALIPLLGAGLTAALAVGSRDPDRFVAGQATDFLTRLGEVVARALQGLLPGEVSAALADA